MHSIQLKKPTKKTKNNEYKKMYLKRKKNNVRELKYLKRK